MIHARQLITLVILSLCISVITGCAGMLEPTAKVTSTGGPDIQQATLEPYDGPKARLAVSQFTVKAAKAHGTVGDGLADMLATALFQSSRYIVLERQALSHVLAEQDLGATGRVRQETATKIGQIEGAELLVMGTVTEFEPGSAGVGGSVGSSIGSQIGGAAGGWPGMIVGQLLGSIAGSVQTSHIAIDVRIVDTRTSRVVAATSVQGKATDITGLGNIAGPDLGVGLSGFSKTPMEKAIRVAIQEAVRFVVSKTPSQYFRYTEAGLSSAPAGPSTATLQDSPVTAPTSATAPPALNLTPPSLPPASETTPLLYVKTQFANLRADPNAMARVLAVLKKGMMLTVLDEKTLAGKDQWYRVKLDDGSEGWVAASVTSLQPE